jgi:hypothetical protein
VSCRPRSVSFAVTSWRASDDRTVRSLDDGESFTMEILDLPWYQPRSDRRPAGEAVTLDRWPIIDETAATRQRLEAITPHVVTIRDVTDIAAGPSSRPPMPTTVRPPRHGSGTSSPGYITTRPQAIDGLQTVIDHARTTYQRTSDPDSICEAFQTLTNELARIPARRDRFEMARC